MARKPIPFTNAYPYHVTARSNNQEWFHLPLNQVWNIFLEKLSVGVEDYNVRIFAFVLMSNHYHMILDTPDANLNFFMNHFQRELSRAIGKATGRINHVFGGTYKGCLIETDCYLRHAYKYLYRNPVAAGICSNIREYPYSTWGSVIANPSTLPFKLHDDLAVDLGILHPNVEDREAWLNVPFANEESEIIRKALRRRRFQFTKDHNFQKTVEKLLS